MPAGGGSELLDVFRVGKAYTVREAAHLAGSTPATVRRWLTGYAQPGHQMAPVFGSRHEGSGSEPLMVSFIELVEIVVVARFRRGAAGTPVRLERLRRAHDYARRVFGLEYPFASLRLREEGGHILHDFQEHDPGPGVLALDIGGQWVLPSFVKSELSDNLDFDQAYAQRWFPVGRVEPIVLDPHIAGGRPSIVGTGVTVRIIATRFEAGEDIEDIAADFAVEPSAVQHALRYARAA